MSDTFDEKGSGSEIRETRARQAEQLSSDIFKLRARALRYGYIGVAEALRLAQDVMEIGAEMPTTQSKMPRVIAGGRLREED